MRRRTLAPLERIPEADLQLPLRVLGRNLSKVAVVRINIQSATRGTAPIRVVEPVEHLEAQRGVLFLGRVKVFEYPEIPVLETRLVPNSRECIAMCPRSGR